MSDDMKFMLQRYPSFKEHIVRTYADNDDFKSLCEDIYSMSQTLEHHSDKIFPDVNRELEYRKLLLELESEFLKFLSDPIE